MRRLATTRASQGRLPDLLDEWSVRRLVEAGANAIKILLYYNPDDDARINTIKQAFIERVGAECIAYDIPFFLEPLAYNDALGDEKGPEFAKSKPELVMRYMEEFAKPKYGVDVLKVEVPVNMTYVEGTQAFGGTKVYSRNEAMLLFREAASVSTKPFIYLSAGVTDAVFRETLQLANEADVNYSGVLCGRATWQDGIPVYAQRGPRGAGGVAGGSRRAEPQRAQRGDRAGRQALVDDLRRQREHRGCWLKVDS